MGEIRQFKRPQAEQPSEGDWQRGEAVCLACGNTWQQVQPIGLANVNNPDDRVSMECPKCKAFKGVYRCFTQYVDVPSWHCAACKCFLFSVVLAKGDVPCLSCASCGQLTNALDVFNK